MVNSYDMKRLSVISLIFSLLFIFSCEDKDTTPRLTPHELNVLYPILDGSLIFSDKVESVRNFKVLNLKDNSVKDFSLPNNQSFFLDYFNGKILFNSFELDKQVKSLFTIDTSETNLLKLVNDEHYSQFHQLKGKFSNDGSEVFYITHQTGEWLQKKYSYQDLGDDYYRLSKVGTSGSPHQHRVYNGTDTDVFIPTQGNDIYYQSNQYTRPRKNIHRMNNNLTEGHELVHNHNFSGEVSFIPNSNDQYIYIGTDTNLGSDRSVYLSSQLNPIVDESSIEFYHPTVTPKGEYFFVIGKSSGSTSLYLYSINGQLVKKVIDKEIVHEEENVLESGSKMKRTFSNIFIFPENTNFVLFSVTPDDVSIDSKTLYVYDYSSDKINSFGVSLNLNSKIEYYIPNQVLF